MKTFFSDLIRNGWTLKRKEPFNQGYFNIE